MAMLSLYLFSRERPSVRELFISIYLIPLSEVSYKAIIRIQYKQTGEAVLRLA